MKNGEHPKILKRYEPIGECSETSCDFITWLDQALACSTFVLVYCSKHFFASKFKTQIQSHLMHHSFETDGSVYDKTGNKYNLIPIRPHEGDGRIVMKMPFTQVGLLMSDFECEETKDDFRKRFVNTFNNRLYIREERERNAFLRLRSTKLTEESGQLTDCIERNEVEKTSNEGFQVKLEAGIPSSKTNSEDSHVLIGATSVVPQLAEDNYFWRTPRNKEKKLRHLRKEDPSFKHLP